MNQLLNHWKSAFLCMATVLCISACSNEADENTPDTPVDPNMQITTETARSIELSRAEQEIVNGQIDLAINFFQKFANDKTGENAICSPYSLSNMLAMISNGLTENAQKEINSFYGIDDNSTNQINLLHSKLLTELTNIDSRVTFTPANAVVLVPTYNFYPEFIQKINDNFGAETLRYDLYTDAGIDQFNQWCSNKTNGMIQNMLEKFGNKHDYIVVSADYFNAKWTIPFDTKDTKTKEFICESGDTKEVATMKGQKLVNTFSDNELSLIQIPYGNQAFRFSVILPGGYESDNGISLSQAVTQLTPEKWRMMNQNSDKGIYTIYLPKFEISTKGTIQNYLQEIGFAELFKTGAISKLSPDMPEHSKSLSSILQAVKIKVEENGTSAASVTLGTTETSNVTVPEDIHINRPFIFIIDEASTGTILYAGVVRTL